MYVFKKVSLNLKPDKFLNKMIFETNMLKEVNLQFDLFFLLVHVFYSINILLLNFNKFLDIKIFGCVTK